MKAKQSQLNESPDGRRFLASELAKIKDNQAEKELRLEAKKTQDYKDLFDNGFYSPNLEDFKKGATIQKMILSKPEYLQYLRTEELRYKNIFQYYLLYDEHSCYEQTKDIIEYIDHEIMTGINDTVTSTTKKKIISYKWLGKEDELEDLFSKMKGVFIDAGTSITDFRKVFNAEATTDIEPIRWINDNATELLYFINAMMEGGLIEKEAMKYDRLKACFCKVDSSSFNESLKEILHTIKKGYTTERKEIDSLMQQFI